MGRMFAAERNCAASEEEPEEDNNTDEPKPN
jgi:hypothetical protein